MKYESTVSELSQWLQADRDLLIKTIFALIEMAYLRERTLIGKALQTAATEGNSSAIQALTNLLDSVLHDLSPAEYLELYGQADPVPLTITFTETPHRDALEDEPIHGDIKDLLYQLIGNPAIIHYMDKPLSQTPSFQVIKDLLIGASAPQAKKDPISIEPTAVAPKIITPEPEVVKEVAESIAAWVAKQPKYVTTEGVETIALTDISALFSPYISQVDQYQSHLRIEMRSKINYLSKDDLTPESQKAASKKRTFLSQPDAVVLINHIISQKKLQLF